MSAASTGSPYASKWRFESAPHIQLLRNPTLLTTASLTRGGVYEVTVSSGTDALGSHGLRSCAHAHRLHEEEQCRASIVRHDVEHDSGVALVPRTQLVEQRMHRHLVAVVQLEQLALAARRAHLCPQLL